MVFCCKSICSTKNDRLTEIKKERGCTDILGFLAFVASWGVMFLIYMQAKKNGGDVNKIIRGTDGYGILPR